MILFSLLSPISASGRPSGWQVLAQVGENLFIERNKANDDKFQLFKTNSARDYRIHGNDNSMGITVKSITISGRCRFKITVPK